MEPFTQDANFIQKYHREFYPVDMNGCKLYLSPRRYGANAQKWWDLSGQDNHGVITGVVPNPSGVGWLFDGVDDNIQFPYSASLNITAPMTLLGWFNPTLDASSRIIAGRWQQTGELRSWEFLIDPAGKVTVYVSTDGTVVGLLSIATNLTLVSSKWNCIALILDSGGNCLTYLNGSANTPVVVGGLPFASNSPYWIGEDGTGGSGENYKGVCSECRGFNRVLTAQEIRNYYELTRHILGV